MNKGICYIVGAGDDCGIDFSPRKQDYVIAADGGLRYLEKANIHADIVIGDFDSLECEPDHPHVITLSNDKDDTDTLAAIREGEKAGYGRFHLYACAGGRIEHTLANIQILAYLAQKNMRGYLFDKDSILTAITDGALSFPPHRDGLVSVFSLSDRSSGVFESGLKFELVNADLTNTFPIGISNEFNGNPSTISVTNGTLLVVFPRKYKEDIL